METAARSLQYVRWPDQPFLRRWEGKAKELRDRLRLTDDEPLDPFALLGTMPGIIVVGSADLVADHPGLCCALEPHTSAWSAAAYRANGGLWMVLYNSAHTRTRTNVSLLEELAHIHLEHAPSKVQMDEHGMLRRTYAKSKEQEAYGVAAAALIPFPGLVRRISSGLSLSEIGKYYGASEPLVRYRMQITHAQDRAKHLRPA